MARPPMETSVTKKGQTNIPAAIRKRHHIHEGDRLVWLDDGEVIRIVPVPKDPTEGLERGRARRRAPGPLAAEPPQGP